VTAVQAVPLIEPRALPGLPDADEHTEGFALNYASFPATLWTPSRHDASCASKPSLWGLVNDRLSFQLAGDGTLIRGLWPTACSN